jgi:hypothetical protein
MKIFAVKGDRTKKAQFACGYETPVEYFDESGRPVEIEEITATQLAEVEQYEKEKASKWEELARAILMLKIPACLTVTPSKQAQQLLADYKRLYPHE